MSYDIFFEVKVEGTNHYVDICECYANTTWNLRDMIVASTGLGWKNEENNGLCVDVIPSIEKGLKELENHPEKYKKYEAENGWGTIEGCKNFFKQILEDWEQLKNSSWLNWAVPVATFWIG